MSDLVIKAVKIYLDGYDLSGKHNQAALTLETDAKDNTCFGAASRSFQPGLNNFSFEHSGFAEMGDGNVDDVLFDNLAVSGKILSVCPITGADGEVVYSAKQAIARYELTGAIGELLTFAGAGIGQAGHGVLRGTIMAAGAKLVTGNGTARQLGHISYDSQQGNLSYTTEGADKSFTDDAQDFEDWESATPNAAYLLMVTNDDTTISWGYLGPKVSATEVKVYEEITLVTSGWNGVDPSAKTPLTYEIWKAGRKIYALMHVLAVAGTNPTLDVTINSDEAVEMGDPTLRFTFAQKAAIGSQWLTPISADIIDTFFRVSWEIDGTDDPSFTVAVVLAVQ